MALKSGSISLQITLAIPLPILLIGLLAEIQKRHHKDLDFSMETLTKVLENEFVVRIGEVNARTWDELTCATTLLGAFSM